MQDASRFGKYISILFLKFEFFVLSARRSTSNRSEGKKENIFSCHFLGNVCYVFRRVEESRNEHGEEEADDWKFQEEKVCEFKGHATRENRFP